MVYKFDDFKWLGRMDGFGVPTDVKYGTIYLGTIESAPDGYVIKLVDTPEGKRTVNQTPKNKFKTKELSANTLHKLWRNLRGGKIVNEVVKKSGLKRLIQEILKEWRGNTSGEWVEPNGTPHNLGHTDDNKDHHYFWAEEYLKTHGPNRFKDDPKEELIARGWMRVVYSSSESLIMVMVGYRGNKYFTKAQRTYLEDQSEETCWLVMDDDGYEIYRPYNCKTPDTSNLQEVTQRDVKSKHFRIEFGSKDIIKGAAKIWLGKEWFANTYKVTPGWGTNKVKEGEWIINTADGAFRLGFPSDQPGSFSTLQELLNYLEKWYETIILKKEDHGLGYSHNSTSDYSDVQLVRDPLNDPNLNGKLNEEEFRFDDFDWFPTTNEFGKPTNVFYGHDILGVIVEHPEGYVIERVIAPHGPILIQRTPFNKFKTKEDAARVLKIKWEEFQI